MEALGDPAGMFAGTGGGGEREGAFGFGAPADAGVAPVTDDQGGVVLIVGEEVGLEGGQVQRPAVVAGFGDQRLGRRGVGLVRSW